ncbi:MAG: HD domain-containing phosphohydrolase [Planctomycetota bacterium]
MGQKDTDKVRALTAALFDQPDLAGLAAAIRVACSRVFGVAHCAVFFIKTGWNEIEGLRPGDTEPIIFPKGGGIAGSVAEEGECLLVEKAAASPLFDEAIDGVSGYTLRDILAAPLVTGRNEIVGVVQLVDKADGRFRPADEDLLTAFGREAGNAVTVCRRLEEWKEYTRSALSAIAYGVDAKYAATVGHSQRVSAYALTVAEAMGLKGRELECIALAATLHNLGRLALNADIGTLGIEEESGQNLLFTEAIVRGIRFPADLKEAADTALQWHEHLDGTGRPAGLKGDQISKSARILVVCDVFDTLFTRGVKPEGGRYTIEEIIAFLKAHAGTRYDAAVVNAFIDHKVHEQEKRRHKRIEYTGKVEITPIKADGTDDTSHITQLLDLSTGGVLFHADAAPPLNTMLKLRIYLATGVMRAVVRTARVFPAKDGPGFRVGAYFIWSA